MHTPLTGISVATPEVTAQGSVTAETARARIMAFVNPEENGAAFLVSPDNPLPVDAGSALPDGAATADNQLTEIDRLDSIITGVSAIEPIAGAAYTDGDATSPPRTMLLVGGTDSLGTARGFQVDGNGYLFVNNVPAASSLVSVSVFDALVSTQLAAANASRKGLMIYVRPGGGDLYLLFGSGTASDTSKSLTIVAGAYYEVPFNFTGELTAILSAAGFADVTELT